MTALLEVAELVKHFPTKGSLFRAGPPLQAVAGVSFTVKRGEVLGLVGESGSGKSTLGNMVLRLDQPTAGRIVFDGQDITHVPDSALGAFRRRAQPIFQDPYGSLDPRMTVEQIVAEALVIHRLAQGRKAIRDQAAGLLELVGLNASQLSRYPHQFSGGQRQRIGIARAMAVKPELIVADEAVSALDVSIQAQIVNLLRDLQRRLGLAMIFISHDLAVVEYIADRVAVLYLGRIMEIAPARAIVRTPKHPYTEALLSAVPEPDPGRGRKRIVLQGELPSPTAPPSGCVFRTRCAYAISDCAKVVPELLEVAPGHRAACIRTGIL
ncbi:MULTISPECIES: ABC transporter ATP-binding protein [unclassified Acidisoma]|jgi:oligopeptide transport system ATP-binding protein|uniref:ABC transporter ATP-binding protein n=1 Tax=unclassified Acidisoma TaxID=2634065 RepID=UPI00131E1400|nr:MULTISPECIES: ABC transporter ATP-binding protein [unclassified Acidisoma]